MANSTSGTSSIYGVNSIYGINSYKNYLSSIYSKKANALSSVLNSAVAANLSAKARSNSSTQSSANSYLTQLNNSINSQYMANATLALSSKKVASTNSAAITGTAQMNAAVKNYSVKVSSLAAGQVNKGSELAANDKSVISKGYNTFKIKSGTTEKNISFLVNDSDTNKSSLNKLATAINKSNAGLKASVETNTNDKVYLKLESTKTGAKNSFTLADRQGTTITSTGLGTVQSKAQDASYSVDGKQYTSSTNTVSLDNGKVQAILKKADNTEEALSIEADAANSKVPDYYTYFNNLLSSGNYYSTNLNSGAMLDMFL